MNGFRNKMVKELMNDDYLRVSTDNTVSEVIGKMRSGSVTDAFVMEGDTIRGMVNYHTLLNRRQLPLGSHIDCVMSSIPTLKEDDDIAKAAKYFLTTNTNRLPVISSLNLLLGSVDRANLVKKSLYEGLLDSTDIKTVMNGSPIFVEENAPIKKAITIMKSGGFKSIPVVNSRDIPVGVIGAKDISDFMFGITGHHDKGKADIEKKTTEVRVVDVMKYPPVTAHINDSITVPVNKMLENNISLVIINDDNSRIIGTLRMGDIISEIARHSEDKGVYIEISGLEEDKDYLYQEIYDIFEKELPKIARFYNPTVVSLRFSSAKGDEGVTTCSLKIITDAGHFYAKTEEWNALKAIYISLESITSQVKKKYEKEKSTRKNTIE